MQVSATRAAGWRRGGGSSAWRRLEDRFELEVDKMPPVRTAHARRSRATSDRRAAENSRAGARPEQEASGRAAARRSQARAAPAPRRRQAEEAGALESSPRGEPSAAPATRGSFSRTPTRSAGRPGDPNAAAAPRARFGAVEAGRTAVRTAVGAHRPRTSGMRCARPGDVAERSRPDDVAKLDSAGAARREGEQLSVAEPARRQGDQLEKKLDPPPATGSERADASRQLTDAPPTRSATSGSATRSATRIQCCAAAARRPTSPRSIKTSRTTSTT